MEIIQCNEGFKNHDGRFAFYCMKGIVRIDGRLHLASWKRRTTLDIERSELFDVQPLRIEDRGPMVRDSWSVVDPIPGHYVKTPELSDYASDKIEKTVQQEIEICEIVRKHPHPNIATYYGCSENRGRAAGLCFKKYAATLSETVNPQHLNKRDFTLSGRPLVSDNIRAELEALRGGLEHLHALNLVHNDITPMNIMMDGELATLVLVDFGSCRHIGESLRSTDAKRTYGWHDPNVDISSIENDWMAFEELMVWLLGSVDKLRW